MQEKFFKWGNNLWILAGNGPKARTVSILIFQFQFPFTFRT